MEGTANLEELDKSSLKVISIAAGEAHSLALNGDGRVYSWGRGMFGRLGTGSEADREVPVQVKFFGSDFGREEKLKIVGIAAGAYHSLALADDGSVWGWGYNAYGQIDASGENYLVPHLLEGFLELEKEYETKNGKPLKISCVKAGAMMSLAIDTLGGLWMWGNCPRPSQINSPEGQFLLVSIENPIPVSNLHGQAVLKVACGNEHVIALVNAGEKSDPICYSWGGNNHGQLGLGDKENRSCPEIIETFNLDSPWEVYEISCGASHTALLSRKKGLTDNSESFCFTFGLGENGQLGHGTTQSFQNPKIVKELPENVFLVSVDCGLFHTSVVSLSGEVWSWGMEKGLGLCPDARFTGSDAVDATSPLMIHRDEINGSRFREPVEVRCGAAHTILVSDAGFKIWSWGRGRSGVLGNGKEIDCYAPTRVLWGPGPDEPKNVVPSPDEPKNVGPGEFVDEKSVREKKEMEEMKRKLYVMERYASLLHGSIFGKPFQLDEIVGSFENSGTFDIAKEWGDFLDKLDESKLARLESFYGDMVAGVKDRLLKRRIQDIVKECLKSSGTRS